jgi:hypothetical protein
MFAIDTQVHIVLSDDLAAMRLSGLIGQRGRVVEQILSFGENLLGYMVCLDEMFLGERLWFVPYNALQADE